MAEPREITTYRTNGIGIFRNDHNGPIAVCSNPKMAAELVAATKPPAWTEHHAGSHETSTSGGFGERPTCAHQSLLAAKGAEVVRLLGAIKAAIDLMGGVHSQNRLRAILEAALSATAEAGGETAGEKHDEQ